MYKKRQAGHEVCARPAYATLATFRLVDGRLEREEVVVVLERNIVHTDEAGPFAFGPSFLSFRVPLDVTVHAHEEEHLEVAPLPTPRERHPVDGIQRVDALPFPVFRNEMLIREQEIENVGVREIR